MRIFLIKAFLISHLVLLQSFVPVNAQVERGAMVPDLSFAKLINGDESLQSFSALKDSLLIVDFFATWCVPCLQALPTLEKVQAQTNGKLGIVLSSQEEEEVLNLFIDKRKSWPFRVIVDSAKRWNNFFKPPSLPFTVVVKHGEVIDIIKAEEISDEKLQEWYNYKPAGNKKAALAEENKATTVKSLVSNNPLVALSQQYVYQAKTGAELAAISDLIKSTTSNQLRTSLVSDAEKKAFWINIYNGYVQAALRSNPDAYNNRSAFFKHEGVAFADEEFSLDDIEHGLLRRSSVKWGFGYLRNPFAGRLKKNLRVNTIDERIHFALNCGAQSCPPIAYYTDADIDQQLTQAAKAYLTSEVEYDEAKNLARLPAILGWFRGDFGGKKGMLVMLKNMQLIPSNKQPKIDFKPYDWTLHLSTTE